MDTERYQVMVVAFFLLCILILFFNLGGRTLENHDYLRYAESAREMIRSGNWLVPRHNGKIYVNKLPLSIWLIALPAAVKGYVTPFISRLPSAVFALLGCIIVFWWAKRIWPDSRSAYISAGVLITSHLYFWQGRVARIDMAFSILILASIFFFILGYQSIGCKKTYFIFSCFIFMGMAFLIKGPAGVLLPLFVISAFLMLVKDMRFLYQKECLCGYVLCISLIMAWFVPFLNAVGWEEFLSCLKAANIISRKAPFYSYVIRIWLDFAPWSFFIPSLAAQFWKREITQSEKLLILWVGGIFLLLTLFPYRNPRYMLPAFPPLALLMGKYLSKKSQRTFVLVFLITIVAWHGKEMAWINRNHIVTQGPCLVSQMKQHLDKKIVAYKIDSGVLEKINFYADLSSPLESSKALEGLEANREIFVLTADDTAFYNLLDEGAVIEPIGQFLYKKKKVILLSIVLLSIV